MRLRTSAVVGGLLASGVGIYTATTARDQVLDSAAAEMASQVGIGVGQARATLETAMEQGLLRSSLQVGIWFVIAGGLLGVVSASVLWLHREPDRQMPAARSGSGLLGWTAAPAPPSDPPMGTRSSVWAVPPAPPAPPEREASRPPTEGAVGGGGPVEP
jgi:hypothetical protein